MVVGSDDMAGRVEMAGTADMVGMVDKADVVCIYDRAYMAANHCNN